MRPVSIVRFERLYALSILLGLVSTLVATRSMTIALPPGTPPSLAAMMPVILLGSAVFGMLIGVVLLWFIARRGSDVALWIFAGLFAIGVAQMARGLAGGTGTVMPQPVAILGLVQIAIQAVCLWLLFRPDAKPWFKDR